MGTVTWAVIFMSASVGQLDQYGGWTGLKGEATGFFHTQQVNDRWWLVDPNGNVFLSLGICHASFDGDVIQGTERRPYREAVMAKYGSREGWTQAALKLLRDNGFNTLGAWCGAYMFDQDMPYTVILNVAARSGASWLTGAFIDVWDERFEKAAQEAAAQECAPRRDSKQLIGYFTDNELHLGPDWRLPTTVLEEYLMMPAASPAHLKALEFLRGRYASLADFNAAWHVTLTGWEALDSGVKFNGRGRTQRASEDSQVFLELVMRRYFQVCRDAIRARDPNHLVLGCRLAVFLDVPVARAARGLVDVFSVNHYIPRPNGAGLRQLYEAAQAPLMVTEWAFRSRDSGLPNTRGAGPIVNTQEDRANSYRAYLTELLKIPFLVGAHWFEYADEPAEGRFDGENSNYGLVNIKDEPYETFLAVVRQTNAEAYAIHAGN